ncbi:MAG: HAD family phosphatase [Usitatibacter sp.]
MKTEALLFDLGGVLISIDFDRVIRRWAELSAVPFQALKPRFDHGEAYQRHERGEIEAKAYYESLRKSLGIELTDAQWEDGWNRVFGPEIAPTLSLLPRLAQQMPLYLFSNTNVTHHQYWSKRYAEALAPFRRQFVSCEMGLRKPEAASFEYVSREIGVPPENILFFDDTLANVEGARAVGLPSVWVKSSEDVRQAVFGL